MFNYTHAHTHIYEHPWIIVIILYSQYSFKFTTSFDHCYFLYIFGLPLGSIFLWLGKHTLVLPLGEFWWWWWICSVFVCKCPYFTVIFEVYFLWMWNSKLETMFLLCFAHTMPLYFVFHSFCWEFSCLTLALLKYCRLKCPLTKISMS